MADEPHITRTVSQDAALLAYIKEQVRHYRAEILPLYPSSDDESDSGPFDEAKNEFLESLWDIVCQHFDDVGEPDTRFALWPCNICRAQKPECDTDRQHFPCLKEN